MFGIVALLALVPTVLIFRLTCLVLTVSDVSDCASSSFITTMIAVIFSGSITLLSLVGVILVHLKQRRARLSKPPRHLPNRREAEPMRERGNNAQGMAPSRERGNNAQGMAPSRERGNNAQGMARSRERGNNAQGMAPSRERGNNAQGMAPSRERGNNAQGMARSRDVGRQSRKQNYTNNDWGCETCSECDPCLPFAFA
ncbi:hypothetical protein HETIRDRAFT_168609 [Heterobasidion irregulare TC 32-1]|uniref:Uncharacterized protein n=1 Tax=Heterobasidion irregulare (strain TC 32-1) TaxID=747525 RepID=W4KHC6_HETIT|nr:uncharacterized protein HETIRDRAFT_168609 [Heterobasidion irregulare TC 32-1]ETW85119.1 hypothetical protein HETIRDRAFT_168609 [Heterobasidion irregulare TC 32-1]